MVKNKLQIDLENVIRDAEENSIDARIKVSVYDINTGVSANVNGKEKGWAASIIKVPVMVSTLKEVEKGNLSLNTQVPVNHKLMLEEYDYVSSLPEDATLSVKEFLYHMIVASDNEATNVLADTIGGPVQINKDAYELGLKRTMLGHLLCPGAPRYGSFFFNPDGSNLTTPNDMVKVMRHIYDPSYTKLSKRVKSLSDAIMSETCSSYLANEKFKGNKIKAKIGIISCPYDGSDIHEVGIIDDSLIVCLMANKIGQKGIRLKDFSENYFSPFSNEEKSILDAYSPFSETYEVTKTYDKIMDVLGYHFGNKGVNKEFIL